MASNSLSSIRIKFAVNIRTSIVISQSLYTWLAINDPPTSIAMTSGLSSQSIILSKYYTNMNDMYECVEPRSIKIYACILSINKKPEIIPRSYRVSCRVIANILMLVLEVLGPIPG